MTDFATNLIKLKTLMERRKAFKKHVGRPGKVGGSLPKGQTHGTIVRKLNPPIAGAKIMPPTKSVAGEIHASGTHEQMGDLLGDLMNQHNFDYTITSKPDKNGLFHLIKYDPTHKYAGALHSLMTASTTEEKGIGSTVATKLRGAVHKGVSSTNFTAEPIDAAMQNRAIELVLHNHKEGDDVDSSETKKTVIGDLAGTTGLSESLVNGIVKGWAADSNLAGEISPSIQAAAAEEFDSELSEWQINVTGVHPGELQDIRAIERVMYDKTQAEFAKAGITHVTLYRGFLVDAADDLGKKGSKVSLKGNALESWTTDEEIARDYSTGAQFGHDVDEDSQGYIFRATVPVSRILSIPRAGFGCLDSAEVVVLGNTKGSKDEAVIVDRVSALDVMVAAFH